MVGRRHRVRVPASAHLGMWRSQVARWSGGPEGPGSNPGIPTTSLDRRLRILAPLVQQEARRFESGTGYSTVEVYGGVAEFGRLRLP